MGRQKSIKKTIDVYIKEIIDEYKNFKIISFYKIKSNIGVVRLIMPVYLFFRVMFYLFLNEIF